MTERTSYDGTKLRALIRAMGMRQDWIARQAGVSPAHLSMILHGTRRASAPVAERLSTALRVPLSLAFDLQQQSNSLHDRNDEEGAAA